MAIKLVDEIVGVPVSLPNLSDVVAFTPTGSWSANTTYTGFVEQAGVKAHVEVRIALTGAPTSASLTLNLPFTIDTTRMISTDTSSGNILENSNVTIRDAGTASYVGAVGYVNSTSVAVYFLDDAAAALSVINPVTQAAPMTFATGDFIIVRFTVPVSGYTAQSFIAATNLLGTRYTPTLANSTNVSACVGFSTPYSRVGNIVSVSGFCTVNCTTGANTASIFYIPIPVPSSLSLSEDAGGVFVRSAASGTAFSMGYISADTTLGNNRVAVNFNAAASGNNNCSFTFQYEVK